MGRSDRRSRVASPRRPAATRKNTPAIAFLGPAYARGENPCVSAYLPTDRFRAQKTAATRRMTSPRARPPFELGLMAAMRGSILQTLQQSYYNCEFHGFVSTDAASF